MGSPEDLPENQENSPFGQRPDEFGFEWTDDHELTPENQKLLDELSIPVERSQPKVGEVVHGDIATEVQNRLEALRVENYQQVDSSWIKATPELQMTPHILDDVHYEVYRKRKREPFNRFVSVGAEQIFHEFSEMAKSKVNGILLQRRQNAKAAQTLIEAAKIEEGSIYRIMTAADGRFAVRSLYRLLREDQMKPFTNLLPKAARRRGEPLILDEVATRAYHFLDIKIRQHGSLDTSLFSNDQRIAYELVSRDLMRTQAFASPVMDYLGRGMETSQPQDS